MKAREKTTGGIIYGAVEYQSNTAEWRVKGRDIAGGYVDCPASDVVMLWNEPDMFFGESVETLGKCAFPVVIQPGYAATGLSRREFFASLAMQGIISGRDAFAIGTAIPDFSKQVAKSAVIFADDLIAEFNKKECEK